MQPTKKSRHQKTMKKRSGSTLLSLASVFLDFQRSPQGNKTVHLQLNRIHYLSKIPKGGAS